MAGCDQCEKDTQLPYRCKYCGGEYCPDHRLPESHSCDGVRFLSKSGSRFESDFREGVSSRELEKPSPLYSKDEVEAVLQDESEASEVDRDHLKRVLQRDKDDIPEPMEITQTVGTPPDIEYEKSPPVKLKSDKEEESSSHALNPLAWVRKLLGY